VPPASIPFHIEALPVRSRHGNTTSTADVAVPVLHLIRGGDNVSFPNRATMFQPGNRANPRGRPRGRSLTSKLRDLLDRGEIDGKPVEDGSQIATLVADIVIAKAMKGDGRLMELLVTTINGRLAHARTSNDSTTVS
jgi:Family of unknown function (DUF5681)